MVHYGKMVIMPSEVIVLTLAHCSLPSSIYKAYSFSLIYTKFRSFCWYQKLHPSDKNVVYLAFSFDNTNSTVATVMVKNLNETI